MSPLLQCRSWWRRAALSERLGATAGAALVVATIAWTVPPPGVIRPAATTAAGSGVVGSGVVSTGARAAAAAGSAPGSSVASAATGGPVASGPSAGLAAVATRRGSQPGASSPVTAAPTASGGTACVGPVGTARGVTAGEIRIGVVLTNIVGPAANSVFGIASPAEQQAQFQAVVNSLNAGGGVACRQLAPVYIQVDPADNSDLQAKCLDMAQDQLYAVIDSGVYAAESGELPCFPQNHLLYFGAYFLPEQTRQQYSPGLFAFDTYDNLYHNTVFGLRDHGYFSPESGFKKLGIFYRTCQPGLLGEEETWLQQAGVGSSQIDTYSFGCPSAFATPADIEQAVLKFQQDGVTNVTYVGAVGDLPNFTNVAQQQGFHPLYGLPDDAMIAVAYGGQPPNYSNLANAVAVTDSSDGEDRTPGMTPSAATAKCMALLRPVTTASSVYPNPAYPTSGNSCDVLWMFAAAVGHAAGLSDGAVAAGLQAAKSVDFAFPHGPDDFSRSGTTTAGEYWRYARFVSTCSCWQVDGVQYRPSYPPA